jgi:predicted DNA-binding transcriptional regulator YafY
MKTPVHNRYLAINACLRTLQKASLEQLHAFCLAETGDPSITPGTILSDLQAMREAPDPGFYAPLSFDPAAQLYFYSDPAYSLLKTPLTGTDRQKLKEATKLLAALRFKDLPDELNYLIAKFIHAAELYQQSGQAENQQYLCYEKNMHAPGSCFLLPLLNAIKNKTTLNLYYQPFTEDRPYSTLVHPYLLKEYQGRWYLLGLNHDRQELRTYGLDRIWEISESAVNYIPKKFSSDDYFKHTVGIIAPSGIPPRIVIEVQRPQAQYLISQPLHDSQLIEQETETHVRFSCHVHPTYEFRARILAMGSDVKVLEPTRLREEIIRELRLGLEGYG